MQTIKKNTARFSTKELSDIFNFKFSNDSLLSINTDSRNISKEEIFLPLVGEKFDGHDFLNDVFNKGIRFSFCEKGKAQSINEEHRSKLIIVENTLDAYHKIANHYRNKINPKVIAVTGSSGKTTVKDLISSVISIKYKTHKTESNFNNEFGVPKTILETPEDTQVLVLELAMRGKGQIKQLSKLCEPDVAVITNVGTAHVGILGSTQAIIEAKCEILEHLRKDGIAMVHKNPQLLQQAEKIWSGKTINFDLSCASEVSFSEGKSFFTTGGEKYFINASGKIHVLNSVLAIKLAKCFEMTKDEIQKGLSGFSMPEGRGNVIKLKDKKEIYLVDESYNANPESLKAAVSNLVDSWDKNYRKVLVIGELAELGNQKEKLLRELHDWLKEKPLDNIITVGDKLREITSAKNVSNIEECCDILKGLMVNKSVVLVKGSHVAGLERVVKHFESREFN